MTNRGVRTCRSGAEAGWVGGSGETEAGQGQVSGSRIGVAPPSNSITEGVNRVREFDGLRCLTVGRLVDQKILHFISHLIKKSYAFLRLPSIQSSSGQNLLAIDEDPVIGLIRLRNPFTSHPMQVF